jgi:hypothetical protein
LVIKIGLFLAKDSVIKEGAKYKVNHGNLRKTRSFMIGLVSNGIQEVVGSIPISSTLFPLKFGTLPPQLHFG